MIDLNDSLNFAVRPRAGCSRGLFLLPSLMAGLGLMLAGRVTAQTISKLHSFAATSPNSAGVYTNADGADPSSLVVLGNTLYGTTGDGGSGNGTVFAVNTDGTGFSAGQVVLAWPSWASDLLLQQTSDLTTSNWTVVTNSPAVVNLQNQVTLTPPISGSTFYRLTH